jgi:LPS O-antigen subunit length determinant protein (WzzB/FepE family)
MNSETRNDQDHEEISLADLVSALWDGRWLIALSVGFTTTLALAFYFFSPPTQKGALEIRPIPSSSAQLYADLNSFEFFKVDQGNLLAAFIEELGIRRTLAAAIRKHEYLKRNSRETEQEYEDRVLSRAYDFELLPPGSSEGFGAAANRANWVITIQTRDPERARLVLRSALEQTNEVIQQAFQKKFSNRVEIARRSSTYQLEDLKVGVKNAFEDYDKQVRNRLAFLKEQAQIARSLGIAKNTIETQAFQAGSSILANIKTDSPFYLRGYDAIEKEIILLQTRPGRDAFVNELIDLETKARAIEQNKLLDRVELAFTNSPLAGERFQSVFYELATLQFQPKLKLSMLLGLSFVAGIFFGFIVVYLRNALAPRVATSRR